MNPLFFLVMICVVAAVSTALIEYTNRLKNRCNEAVARLEREKAVLTEAMSCTDEYLWRIDLEADTFWIQKEFYRLVGAEPGEEMHPVEEVRQSIHEDDFAKLEGALADSNRNERIQTAIRIKHKSGHLIWVHVNAKIIRDETLAPKFITGAVMDITTLIATEEALREAHETIERSRKLNASFLARMSHEIRTPLNAVTGYVQLLEREIRDRKVKEHLAIVKDSTTQLVEVMSEIIDAGRLEAGEITLKVERIDLTSTMQYFEDAFTAQAAEKGIDLQVTYHGSSASHILADEVRLNQIISNLLSNAIKYTDEGTVKLTLYAWKCSYNRLELKFTVEDTGAGFENQDMLAYLNSEMNAEEINLISANGLGLSIVYNLVKIMKGQMHVRSTSDGTCFDLVFRVTMAPGEHVVNEVFDAGMFFEHKIDRSKKILIAEDNEINRLLLADILRMMDLNHFDLADDGQKALELYRENEYELIITDIQMPNVSGSEMAREIRKTDEGIPIIAMTANILDEQLAEYYAAGINDYVAKPVDIGHLKDVLYKYLK